jgi:hypothetical protein
MKNKELHDLNFKELLKYPAAFEPQNPYEKPIECSQFCVECEKNGIVPKDEMPLMSHGCDSSDFIKILKEMPASPAYPFPVMFILEEPGGDDDGTWEATCCAGTDITKKIPDKFYYFAPKAKTWPLSIQEVIQDGNYYGNYFAYLMYHHRLSNVYITNLVKCKGKREKREGKCIEKFLVREVKYFAPKIILCFRKNMMSVLQEKFPDMQIVWVYHPSYIRRTWTEKTAAENDRRIEAALAVSMAVSS